MKIKSLLSKVLNWLILLFAGIVMFVFAFVMQKVFGIPFFAVLYAYVALIFLVILVKTALFIRESNKNKREYESLLNTEIIKLNRLNEISNDR